MKVVELRVTVSLTDQQIRDYAEEFGIDAKEVLRDIHDYLVCDLEPHAKSDFWTAVVQ